MLIYLVEELDSVAYKRMANEFEFTKDLSIADIVISRNLKIDKDFILKAKNLKCIAIHGTGVSECDVDFAKERGITVFNTPYQNYESVAEMNILLALQASRPKYSIGKDLYKKTALILGYGHVGKRTEEILKAFSMNVLIYKRNNAIKIEELLPQADYIFINMSLNDDTFHFINKEKIDLLKKDVIIVNTARGSIVNEKDLLIALKEKRINTYASDVFEDDPLKDFNPLLKENVIGYPHIGGNTIDSLRKIGELLYEELMEFKENKRPKYAL